MSEKKEPQPTTTVPATVIASALTVIPPPIQPRVIAMNDRGIVVTTHQELWSVATILHQAHVAPKDIETVEKVYACLLMGMEIGLPLRASLDNICVINGRSAVWGDCMLGLVKASPICEFFEETLSNDAIDATFRTLCLTTDKALRRELRINLGQLLSKIDKNAPDFGSTACTRRRGGEERFGRFTRADAETAGLLKKAGPWTQTPFRMLTFRARNFLLRDVYPDVLKGIRSVEEECDIRDADRFAGAIPTFEVPTPERQLPEPAKEVAK